MSSISSVHEIELKALLSKEKYGELRETLPKKLRLLNEETMHIQAFKPGDVRLRHSDRRIEIVCKDEDPTRLQRKEITIPLKSMHELEQFAQVFEMLGHRPGVPWIKSTMDFEMHYKGYAYELSLQFIENFAYILEVELKGDSKDIGLHEKNITEIMQSFGCDPINPADFKRKINEYQKDNYFK